MLNKHQLGQNKLFRIFAYTITIGFILLLFLPTSIGFRELFSGRSNDFIQVNNEEVFFKSFPLYQFEPRTSEPLSELFKQQFNLLTQDPEKKLPKLVQKFILEHILDNWKEPIGSENYEKLRMMLKLLISWQMNLDLAKQIGLELNQKDLTNLAERSYREYLAKRYEEFIQKNPDLNVSLSDFFKERYEYHWPPYQEFAQKHLIDQFIHFVLTSNLHAGTLIPKASLEQELSYAKNKIKLSYALFNYTNYLENDHFLPKIDKKKLELYYKRLGRQKIVANKVTFGTKEEANHAKRDAALFDTKSKKYNRERVQIQSSKGILFSQLLPYNVNHISTVLENNSYNPAEKDSVSTKNRYAIYQILVKGESFKKIAQNKNKYKALAREYATEHYAEFKNDFESKGNLMLKLASKSTQSTLKRFLKTNKTLKSLKIESTKWFNLNDRSILLENDKRNDKKEESPISKELINSGPNQIRQYNINVFESIYSAKQKKLIPVTSQSLTKPAQKIFVLVQKQHKQESSLSKNIIKQRQYQETLLRQSDYSIVSDLWVDYLIHQFGFSVRFNKDNILRYFNIADNQ